jgi:hypothetical protein
MLSCSSARCADNRQRAVVAAIGGLAEDAIQRFVQGFVARLLAVLLATIFAGTLPGRKPAIFTFLLMRLRR